MLKDDEILYIFVEIAGGTGQHGGFLRSYAEAIANADNTNFSLLRAASNQIIVKYNLTRYLENKTV